MWSEVTVGDEAKIERFRQIAAPSLRLGPLRSKIKRSGFSYYLYEDGFNAIGIALGMERRSGRYFIRNLSITDNLTPTVGVPLVVSKLIEYSTAHGVAAFHLLISEDQNRDQAKVLDSIQHLIATPGITVIQTPRPPGFYELEIGVAPPIVPP